jgi:hypothetical protein
MKSLKQLPPPSKSDKRMLAASIIIFLASCILVGLAINSRTAPGRTLDLDINGNPIDLPQGTLMPGVADADAIIKQLTAMPSAQPLTGPLADEVRALAQMVSNCKDYVPARRDQMNQHIAWLLQPNTLPKEVIIALGTNINGGLILGMATYTLAEWGQHSKAPDSCLLPIGKKLNDMLANNGQERMPQFDSVG